MKKIVIIGPESTGKSTLCEQLSIHYKTLWVPEYAREYLLINGARYIYEDLLAIAKGQVALEEKYLAMVQDNKLRSALLIDTDMYVLKVWCEFVFSRCHHWIIDRIVERTYDLYLLCNIDLPWVSDQLREYPELEPRKKLYNIYKDILINQSTPWKEIKGNYEARLQSAISEIDKLNASAQF